MINKVMLIGNLGADPEVKRLESGSTVARFSLATNESYRDKSGEWQTQTEWHNVVCWRALAERAENQLKKGSMVYVEGKVSYRKWQDSEGRDRYTTDIVALTFRSLDRRETSEMSSRNFPSEGQEPPSLGGSNDVSSDSFTPPTTPSTTKPVQDTPMEDDDLPF